MKGTKQSVVAQNKLRSIDQPSDQSPHRNRCCGKKVTRLLSGEKECESPTVEIVLISLWK